MIQRRIDSSYGRRVILVNAGYLVPGLIAILIAVGRPRLDWLFCVSLVVLLVCLATGTVVTLSRRVYGYRCPQCRAHIPKPIVQPSRPGEPFDYYCAQCDILWHAQPQLFPKRG